MGKRSKRSQRLSGGSTGHDELTKSKSSLGIKKCNNFVKKNNPAKTAGGRAVNVAPSPSALSVTSVGRKKRRKNRRKKETSCGKNELEQSMADSEELQSPQRLTPFILDENRKDSEKGKNKMPLGIRVAKKLPASKITLPEEETSGSDLEQIHANWEFFGDSRSSEESKYSNVQGEDDESDLDGSLEDEDEVIHDSDGDEGSSGDSDDDVELAEPIGDVGRDELKVEGSNDANAIEVLDDIGSKSEALDANRRKCVGEVGLKTENDFKSVVKPQIFTTENKVFSMSNETELLEEILRRTRDLESRSLYLAPIPADCTVEMIKKFIPKVKCCQFFLKPKAKKLRTFAFLEFEDMETAGKERLSVLGRLFGGRTVRAELRSSQASIGKVTLEDVDLNNLVVNGLSPSVTLEDLKQVFPTADSIRMPSSQGRINHGHAHLNYVSKEVALDAFSLRHNYRLKENPISVNFKFKSAHNDISDQAKPSPPTGTPSRLFGPEDISKDKQEAPTITSQRIGKVVIQRLSSGSNSVESCLKASDLTGRNPKKAIVKESSDAANSVVVDMTLSKLINQAKLKRANQASLSESNSENEDKERYDSSGSDEGGEGLEMDEEEDVSEASSANSGASVDVPAGDNSEGEADDAALQAVLKARRTCARALRAPGARRNWQASRGKKRAAVSMPKVIPVPAKRRK